MVLLRTDASVTQKQREDSMWHLKDRGEKEESGFYFSYQAQPFQSTAMSTRTCAKQLKSSCTETSLCSLHLLSGADSHPGDKERQVVRIKAVSHAESLLALQAQPAAAGESC